MAKSIADTSLDGLFQITDTSYVNENTTLVTVREMIGQHWEDYGNPGLSKAIRAARELARHTVPVSQRGGARASQVRRWYANGQSHVTFRVTAGSVEDSW